jgi:hypothetical protein
VLANPCHVTRTSDLAPDQLVQLAASPCSGVGHAFRDCIKPIVRGGHYWPLTARLTRPAGELGPERLRMRGSTVHCLVDTGGWQ